MPKVTTIQNAFTAGEASPRVYGRTDLPKYQQAAKTMRNCYPLVHGGAKKRPGTMILGVSAQPFDGNRIIPFPYSRDEAYAIALVGTSGASSLQIYSAPQLQAASYNVVNAPWSRADLQDIRYAQLRESMYFVHPRYPPYRLTRRKNDPLATDNFTFEAVPFVQAPTEEIGEWPNASITLSAASGAAVTCTASAACFQTSDVGRYVESAAGRGLITAFTSTTQVTINTGTTTFEALTIGIEAWRISDSPQTTCTPSATGPIGATITLTLGAAGWKSLAALSHVGYCVEINGGLVQITGFTSTTVVNAIVRTLLTSTSAASPNGWVLRAPAWTFKPVTASYPRAVCVYQQRLFFASTDFFPTTIWGSVTGDELDFSTGAGDEDALSFVAAEATSAIEHLVSARSIIALSGQGEIEISGGIEKPITPTSVSIRLQSTYGCTAARPVMVGPDILFVQRGGRRVRALAYRSDLDSYSAPDVTLMSEHITAGILREITYEQHPDSVLWGVLEDGSFVSLSIDRDQEVSGWARHDTDGKVFSMCSVPAGDSYTTFLYVQRKRYDNNTQYGMVEHFSATVKTDGSRAGDRWISAIYSHPSIGISYPSVSRRGWKGARSQWWSAVLGTLGYASPSGKYYFEVTVTSGFQGEIVVGLFEIGGTWQISRARFDDQYIGKAGIPAFGFANDGTKRSSAGSAAYSTAWAVGDVIGVAVDLAGLSVTFYRNNVSAGAAFTLAAATAYLPAVSFGPHTSIPVTAETVTAATVNVGDAAFVYTPPSGHVAVAPPSTAWGTAFDVSFWGATLSMVGEGKYLGDAVLSSGALTTPVAVRDMVAGRKFTMELATLPTEIGTGTGTAQGNASSVHEAILRIHSSVGGTFDAEALPNAPTVGQVPTVYTGDQRKSMLGWGRTGAGDWNGVITITHDLPFDFQVLALIKRMTVNDG